MTSRSFDLADGTWIILTPPSDALRIRNQFSARAQELMPKGFREIFGSWPSMT